MQDEVIKMLMSKGRVCIVPMKATKFGIDVMLDIVNHTKSAPTM
jgi:hypothetical protein